MPRKIENKLRTGQSSKIYFYAFPKPITGYKLAQIITGENRPFTARIYTTIKSMIKEGLISKVEGGYQSNSMPLLNEIESTLKRKEINLSSDEKDAIIRILQNDHFKEVLASTSALAYTLRDVDPVQEISNILGVLSLTFLVMGLEIQFISNPSLPSHLSAEKTKMIINTLLSSKVVSSIFSKLPPFPFKEIIYQIARGDTLSKLLKLLPIDIESIWNAIR